MAAFEIYEIPSDLTFTDYLNICQCARTLADGYDRKDKARLHAALAPDIIVDYTHVVPKWGRISYKAPDFIDSWLGPQHLGVRALATQHLLGIPYFKSVTSDEILVQWQQLASHGRREKGEDYSNPMSKIGDSSDGRGWMEQKYVKVEGRWRIQEIKPEVLYHTGDFLHIARMDED